MENFDKIIRWWSSLTNRKKQQWLLVFIHNMTFEDNYTKNNSVHSFENIIDVLDINIETLQETKPPKLEREKYINNNNIEYVNSKINECKNHLKMTDELMNSINEVDNEYWEKYGGLIKKYNE